MDKEFDLLDENEVLHVRSGRILMPNPTFRVGEFLDALAQLISEQEGDWSEDSEGWFGAGLPCEVLRFSNQGWQRGRVRIRLEFSTEKPRLLRDDSSRRNSRETPYNRSDDVYSRRDDVYIPQAELEDDYDRNY